MPKTPEALTAPAKRDGFVVKQDIATHTADQVTPEGMLDIQYIGVELRITYPEGFDLTAHEQDIQKSLVRLLPAAYVELERRAS